MANTPKVGAPIWAASEASPWLMSAKRSRIFDAFSSRAIIEDRDLSAPPGSCADGACYLVKAAGTGAWAGLDGRLVIAVGANASNGWYDVPVAAEGFALYVRDENIEISFDGAAWVQSSGAPTESFIIAASDEATALTAGTNKVKIRMPYAFTLTAIRASLVVAQTSGSIFTVDVNEAGVSVLSTKLTIDNGEKTSTTAAAAPVISDASLADDAEISVDIDQIGDGTAKGLKVTLIGHQ